MKEETEKQEFDRWMAEWLALIQKRDSIFSDLADEHKIGTVTTNNNEELVGTRGNPKILMSIERAAAAIIAEAHRYFS